MSSILVLGGAGYIGSHTVYELIAELVVYGLENGLIDDADKVYVTNGLLELFQRQDYQEPEKLGKPRKLQLILDDLL